MNIRKIIKEEVLNLDEWGFIHKLTLLSEEELNNRTFSWDIVKDNIDHTKEKVKTRKQAEKYLNIFLDKVMKVPKQLKIKMVRYVIMGLTGILAMSTITKNIETKAPDIKKEVLMGIVDNTTDTTNVGAFTPKSTVTPSNVSDTLIKFLKHEEGSPKHKGQPVLTAYSIGDGMVTVGWGHAERTSKSQFSKGQKINLKQAEELLKKDVGEAESGLNRLLKRWDESGIEHTIDQGMYDAMVSMIFNMGLTNFLKSDFIQLVKKGEYEKAGELIEKTHITYPGHVRRRKKESEMFGSV
jgi:lysozyme